MTINNMAIDIMQNEIAALRLVNETLEKHISLETEHADAMLRELETQRDALRIAHKTQKQLGSFIQRVMDCARNLLIVLTPDGRVHMSNRPCEEMLGVTAQQLQGTVLDDLLPADERAALAAQLPPRPWPVHSLLFETISHQGNYRAEHQLLSSDGSYRCYLFDATVLHGAQGKQEGAVICAADITLRKAAENEIRSLAFYDPLTRLPNRRLLMDRLQRAIVTSDRNGCRGALLFIDLDNFKMLNDTFGHDKGDLLLQQVAQRLASSVRENDTVARLGGDEFVVLLENLSANAQEAEMQAGNVGRKILATLNQAYQLANRKHWSTPSIGLTLFSNHRETVEELMKQADQAMYQAKAAGRNGLRFFNPEMQSAMVARTALGAALRDAPLKNQFVLHYQAQLESNGDLTGAEALVRWEHPRRGTIPPDEFIPLAEETGLILSIGHWVLKTACIQLTNWAAQPEMAHLTIAVNISVCQFQQIDFVDQVIAVIEQTGANPQRLKMELTESVMISNTEDIIAKIGALKAKGIGFSLDDFGTGYSSLAYLKRLPLDCLKIDRSFINGIATDIGDAAITKMVITLGKDMGLTVIAEGVENEAQRDILFHQGCHAYQGYLFSPPLPLMEFETFVKRSKSKCSHDRPLRFQAERKTSSSTLLTSKIQPGNVIKHS